MFIYAINSCAAGYPRSAFVQFIIHAVGADIIRPLLTAADMAGGFSRRIKIMSQTLNYELPITNYTKGGVPMFIPTPFGIMLKESRENSKLSQGELSAELGKTAQYISNIEKGKNNSPPDDADLQKLIKKLCLDSENALKFRLLAYADRGMLPPEMFRYVLESPALINLINYAMSNNIPEDYWGCMLQNINKGEST